MQESNLLNECVALPAQLTRFLHRARELLLVPLGEAPPLGGVCRKPLDVADELLVALLGLGERGFRAALGVARFLGL